jgi:hypothetical protein
MSDESNIRRLQEGHQPSKDEFIRGYQPKQTVDVGHLKPPSNLGTAAVTPQNSSQPAHAEGQPKK